MKKHTSTRPTVDRKYRFESFLAMNPPPEPTISARSIIPIGPPKSAKSSTTATPSRPLNPTEPLSPIESSREEQKGDAEFKPPVTLLYVICWLLVLPVAMCVGFVTSPRHGRSNKTAVGGPSDLEKGDAGMDAVGKMPLSLGPVTLRGAGVRLDALPETEEGMHAGSKGVVETEKS